MTKSTKWHVRPAKTQISLGIRPVWSKSSLSAWRKLASLDIHWTHSEDSDQTRRIIQYNDCQFNIYHSVLFSASGIEIVLKF